MPAPPWNDDQWDDMVDLLTYIAAADRRTVGTTDVRVWLDAARDGEWPSIEFAYRAVVRHRNEQPGRWLEPGHVTQLWRQLRRAASRSFDPAAERVPDGAADDPVAYTAWVRGLAQAHLDDALAGFLAGRDPGPLAIEGGRS
jgi:hypothetical protein